MEINIIEKNMSEAMINLQNNFQKIRTGRATPAILEDVKVEAYGNISPLNQVAIISC